MNLKVTGVASRKPPVLPRSPHIRMARWPETYIGVYWRRERAHDKIGERVVFVVCTVGAFIRCLDNVKSEKITRGEKMTKVR